MKVLFRYSEEFGRMGDLEGLFIADLYEFQEAGDYVYFGEALGKHSEIYSQDWKSHTTMVTNDQKVVAVLESIAQPDGTVSGYNPIAILKEQW